MDPFSTHWKYQKTLRFSDVFRGYRKGALGTNGLIPLREDIEYWYKVFSIQNVYFYTISILHNARFWNEKLLFQDWNSLVKSILFKYIFINVLINRNHFEAYGCWNGAKRFMCYQNTFLFNQNTFLFNRIYLHDIKIYFYSIKINFYLIKYVYMISNYVKRITRSAIIVEINTKDAKLVKTNISYLHSKGNLQSVSLFT